MKFGDAVTAMENQQKVYRPKWDESKAQEPGDYIKLEARNGPEGRVPVFSKYNERVNKFVATAWLPSAEDIVADDWEIRQ